MNYSFEQKVAWSQERLVLNLIFRTNITREEQEQASNKFGNYFYFICSHTDAAFLYVINELKRTLEEAIVLKDGFNSLKIKMKNSFGEIEKWEVNVYV